MLSNTFGAITTSGGHSEGRDALFSSPFACEFTPQDQEFTPHDEEFTPHDEGSGERTCTVMCARVYYRVYYGVLRKRRLNLPENLQRFK